METDITYQYDKLNRLVKETIERNGNKLTNEYAYDKVSNRVSKKTSVSGDLSVLADTSLDDVEVTEGTTTYTYNAGGQLIMETSPAGSVIYTYDDNGNLVSRTGDKTVTYSYDKENHLLRATIQKGGSVTVESYTYDYAGNRTSKTVNGTDTIYYVTDVSGDLPQVVAETDEAGNNTTFYTRGEDLISMEKGDEICYYLYDGHGNVRILTNAGGRITDRYSYDAYGNLLEKEGDTENEFLYTGEQYNANTGLYYLRARYMNPSTGTFISMDSYQGSIYDPVSLHKYLYANANPVMYKDPTGYMGYAIEMAVRSEISAEEIAYNQVVLSIGINLIHSLAASMAVYNATVRLNEAINTIIETGLIFEDSDKIKDRIDSLVVATTAENTSSNKRYVVYTLVDAEGVVRYVGRTNDYGRRMKEHRRPGGKIQQYNLDEGEVIFDNLTKEQARGLEQSLIVLYHTQNFLKDPDVGFYNFINGVSSKNKKRDQYHEAAKEYMNEYPSMFENFREEELNALKEDMGTWW